MFVYVNQIIAILQYEMHVRCGVGCISCRKYSLSERPGKKNRAHMSAWPANLNAMQVVAVM